MDDKKECKLKGEQYIIKKQMINSQREHILSSHKKIFTEILFNSGGQQLKNFDVS